MKASIVIPVYNAENFLSDCLASVAKQDYPSADYEIVIVNDGSKDGSASIINQFARQQANVRVIHQTNQGPALARTKGLQEARGKYIFILSHDCMAVSNWVSTVVGIFEADESIGVVQGKILAEKQIDLPLVHCTRVEQFSFSFETAGIAYRAQALDEVGRFFDDELAEFGDDTDLAWRILEGGYRSEWIDQPLVYHKILPQKFWPSLKKGWGIQKFALLLRKHPGIRKYLRFGFIWGGKARLVRMFLLVLLLFSLVLKLSLFGFLLLVVLLVSLINSTFKQTHEDNISNLARLLIVLPHLFLSELIGSLALLLGSLRYRSLVL